jgi:6,7-dimethyl-8-ribityllumazine synthase
VRANLSKYDVTKLPDKEIVAKQHYAIVGADWNADITYKLSNAALHTLHKSGGPDPHIRVIHVPGTVELTYAAARLMGQVDAIIVIGCVIKGDTPHFDYVCQSVTEGVTRLNSMGRTPVIFSVLTVTDKEQARERAGGELGNKGVEGAITAIRMANLQDSHARL